MVTFTSKAATKASRVVPAVASIAAMIQIRCCSGGAVTSIDEKTVEVSAESGGRELYKFACSSCGAEYMFGVIARTREQSLADEAFEQIGEDELEQIGVDTKDTGDRADSDEVRMCAKCDGTAAQSDWCAGCRDYVHRECRTRAAAISGRHHAEYHWQEPGVRAGGGGGAGAGFVVEEGGGEVPLFVAGDDDDGSGPDDEPDYARG